MRISVTRVIALCLSLICLRAESSIKQPYRTAYHFQPPQNWMNGPMLYKGLYHLFYQHNPYGPLWGNITWGHSVSYDLINWLHLPHALSPTDPFDIKGCFSGSTTILSDGNPTILYTGVYANDSQVQNLALPKNLSDPFLREWVKSPLNPLMIPIDGIDPKNFRDPSTAWQGPDGIWRVIIGANLNGQGTAILYQSKDFVSWTRSTNPFRSSSNIGMFECPDFYPVSINGNYGVDTSSEDKFTKHVLKASFNGNDHYILGSYTPQTNNFSTENDFLNSGSNFQYDYGKFYASKTFFDSSKKRRISWGWIAEMDGDANALKKGWSGLQSIPRSILLSKTGKQLIQWPIKETETLRAENVSIQEKQLKGGSVLEVLGITASQADIEVSFDLTNLKEAEFIVPDGVDPRALCIQRTASFRGMIGPFGLLVLASQGLTEQTAIFFRIFRSHEKYVVLMCSDQSRSTFSDGPDKTTYGTFIDIDPRQEKITLRSLIDHSVVESFGGKGRACITARVYPALAIDNQAHLYAFNNGTVDVTISRLDAWSMKKAQLVSANI
ncbi:hypothetical protein CRYUN_Cryun09bG0223500 [Craigia yunnanensis]